MKLTVPVIGTAISYEDGGYGDPDDPIRLVELNLGNVSWQLIKLDLDEDVAEIEVLPGELIAEDTGEVDGEGKPIYAMRPATNKEKQAFLNYARTLIQGHTKEELYNMSGSAKLKKPKKKR